MTIVNQSIKRTVQGNGAQTVFSYSFLIPSKDAAELHLLDIPTGVLSLLPASSWSLSGAGNSLGGTFTYPSALGATALQSTQKLTLVRTVPNTQITTLQNQSGFQPRTVEAALDRIVMQVQQFAEKASRTLLVPVSEDGIAPLPTIEQRAGKFLGFDNAGNIIASGITAGGLTVTPWSTSFLQASGAPEGRAALGFSLTPWSTSFLGAANSAEGLSALGLSVTPWSTSFLTGASASAARTLLGVPYATQAQAEAGTSGTEVMTPQRSTQHFRVKMGEDWSHNAKYYGVVADDTGIGTPTDNTAAMAAYLQILSNTGMPGFWAGRVYCASNLVWDVGPSWERGASLSGVARQGSRLRFGGGIAANTLGLRIHSTTQPFLPGFSSYDWLGLRLSQIHILANHDGFALGIGRDDLNGPLNVAVFDQCTVFNTYTGFNSGAWWLKHVVNSYFQMCAGNCFGGTAAPYYGTSLRLERVQFTDIDGGSFGNCNIGWQLRDFTNTITADAVDIEAMRVGIQTESAPVGGIRMRGPRLALAGDYCIQLLDGSASDILSIESYSTDVPAKFVHPAYGRGLLLKDKNGITQPSFAWDTNITNNTHKVVEVTVLGGTPTGIVVNGFDFGAQATTRMLNPGDVIRVNGSGAGAWVWNPMQQ